jgi:hypothetical protein
VAASCERNGDGPLAPAVTPGADSTRSMLILQGQPRVFILFDGGATEQAAGAALTGSFPVLFDDSLGRRVFLPGVRFNGVAMNEERDQFGSPIQSTIDLATALPGLAMADTLRLEVFDGGLLTPPFTVGVVPSRVLLAADSTIVPRDRDLVLPFTGRIERLTITLTDVNGKRLRFQLSIDNFSGISQVVVPARDLRGLAPGPLAVATNILDVETRTAATGQAILVNYQSSRRRAWILAP